MIRWTLWDCLTDLDKAKLKSLMPPDWHPPGTSRDAIQYDCKLEDTEEIGWLMRKPPNYGKDYPHG